MKVQRALASLGNSLMTCLNLRPSSDLVLLPCLSCVARHSLPCLIALPCLIQILIQILCFCCAFAKLNIAEFNSARQKYDISTGPKNEVKRIDLLKKVRCKGPSLIFKGRRQWFSLEIGAYWKPCNYLCAGLINWELGIVELRPQLQNWVIVKKSSPKNLSVNCRRTVLLLWRYPWTAITKT